jgi:hypothetical protein
MNFIAIFVAALIPLFVGFIWYSDFLFGKKWKSLTSLDDATLSKANPLVLFGSVYILCLLLAMAMNMLTIHQTMIPGLFVVDGKSPVEGSEEALFISNFMTKYGHLHRTFKHGMVHGIINTIMLVLPIIGINSLFERRGWTYIFIHVGYWNITFALMGGLICAWR